MYYFVPDHVLPKPAKIMYEYQEDGIAFLNNAKRAILGDEPGLGKTRQALLAATGRTLIVAPAGIHDGGVWVDELQKWTPELEVYLASYHDLPAKRDRKFLPVLNPEIKAEHRKNPFETVIFDEAHNLKSRKSHWTKAVTSFLNTHDKRLAPNVPEKVFLLSGTPIPNWVEELFVPLSLTRYNDTLKNGYLSSYWRWVGEHFDLTPSRFGGPFTQDIGGLRGCTSACVGQCEHWAAFHRKAFTYEGRLIFLQRLRDNVLKDLPPMTEQLIRLPMTPFQAKSYKDFKRDFIVWLKDQNDLPLTMEAWSKVGQFTKLLRCASGVDCAVYPDVLTSSHTANASNKLNLLMDLIQDQAQPSLVVTWFKATAHIAKQRLEAQGKRVALFTGDTPNGQRKQIIHDFQAGRYDVMVATIATIKEGFTLTAADTIHLLERSFVPSQNLQVIRRIHRIGQTRPVSAITYLSSGTAEIGQLQLLMDKQSQQNKMLMTPQEILEIL